ncbi:hypothetical protein EDC01DRAFT_719380 [Geopyxis carbonaria]|nr:hypothetical protein EDC01DRAFT_719380 [Geopyxis carbonaria]
MNIAQSNTNCVTSTATDSSSPNGLHNLVNGLAISPASSITSPTSSSVFGAASTSILNNTVGASAPPIATSASSVRLQTFDSRKLNYSVSSGGRNHNNATTKEVDDPSAPSTLNSAFDRSQTGPRTLSRLFATPSPQNACGQSSRSNSYRGSDSIKLEEFLYTRGFLEGTCSDITILAFGNRYRLHRLILDRSPYFSSCFNGGPWVESTSSEITLSPEKSDPNIVQHAFELALARLYGHVDKEKEDQNALPLFAVASYLELQDLAESCVASLLRNLKPSNISSLIKFVTNSYYGPRAERLLDSARALLYRDGWEMDLRDWDGISGEFAAEIIGFEGFYVPTEYARYSFLSSLINWRMEHRCGSPATTDEGDHDSIRSFKLGDGANTEPLHADDSDANIRPLQELLHTGIYYVHMSFEELQKIGGDTNVMGQPMVNESIVRDALWQQMLLRQHVLNSPHDSAELGITKTEQGSVVKLNPPGKSHTLGSKRDTDGYCSSVDHWSTTTLEQGIHNRYYIPTEDSTTVIGDCPEQPPQVIVSQRGVTRNPTSNDSVLNPTLPKTNNTESGTHPTELRYSQFPPFRFSAEFKSVRTLKEKKRVYSKTVFYAGSYWNIYIQKVKSSKNVQLGVYLHRAKDREGSGSSNTISRDGKVSQTGTSEDRGSERQRRNDNEDFGDTTYTEADATSTTLNSQSRIGTDANLNRILEAAPGPSIPALGHYVDSRSMIQTYFKIFSPSRKGKMLSMFSSGPDSFNFSQSWGWKSSSLILEEGLIGESDSDSRLRFMVVLGMIVIP